MMKFNNKEVNDVLFNGQPINVLQYNGITVWERTHGRLPKEYQEVEYLESTGTQYIDTGVKATFDMTISFDMDIAMVNASIFGDFTRGTRRVTIYRGASTHYVTYYLCAKYIGLGPCLGRTSLRFNTSGEVWVNGEYKQIGSQSIPDFNNVGTMYLFSENRNTTYCQGKIYFCTIEVGNDKVLDLVPCYRKADHKPGMYDLVNGEFFTNQGSGEFIVGKDI